MHSAEEKRTFVIKFVRNEVDTSLHFFEENIAVLCKLHSESQETFLQFLCASLAASFK